MKKLLLIPFLLVSSILRGQNNDTINFENLYPFSNNWNVLTIDSLTGIWQKGMPAKNIFDQALSLPYAAVTDTLNDYPVNNDSYFYFHVNYLESCNNGTGNAYAYLNLFYKLETDSLNDNGYLEFYSNNQWFNVNSGQYLNGWMFDYLATSGYDLPTNYGGNSIFTGSSLGWMHSRLMISCFAIAQPADWQRGSYDLIFRLHFHSDSISENKDGWMIDNIVWENFSGICVGAINENNLTNELMVNPTLTSNYLYFETESERFTQISIFDLSGKQIETFSFTPTNFKTLQLSQLASGMYFYSIDEGKAKGKFVIER